VRFREQSLGHEVVRRALMEALGQGGVPQLQLRPEAAVQQPVAGALPGIVGSGVYPNRWVPDAARPNPDRMSSPDGLVRPMPDTTDSRDGTSAPGEASGGDAMTGEASGFGRTVPEIRPMIPLGQFRDTFIIAVDDEGIAIIDQHVAHERVLFERVMERLTSGPLQAQRLLVPLVMDLSPPAQQTLLRRAPELERLGFDIEEFGATAIKVSSVPALLGTEDSSKALIALAEDLEGLDRGAQVQEALQRIAATTACHAAVKANAPLTYEKMAHILDELRATAYSTVCPHGRPVMLRLTRREVEKNFERI
jgi:DNA mismatch repair protein MutL